MVKLDKVLGLNCDGRNSIPKSSLWHYVTELQSVIINGLFSFYFDFCLCITTV